MNPKEIEKYIGEKNIKIVLKNGYTYRGMVGGIENNTVRFVDKFGLVILIDLDNVSAIEIKKER